MADVVGRMTIVVDCMADVVDCMADVVDVMSCGTWQSSITLKWFVTVNAG